MKIPLFPLEVVLFPEAALPLHIFEDRYKEMVGVCLEEKIGFGVVCAQREGLAVVGCTAEIVRILERYPDGRMDILCQGAKRFEIENLDNTRSFLQAEVDFFGDDGLPATRAMREQCTALHFEVLELMGGERHTGHSIWTSRLLFDWRGLRPPIFPSALSCWRCDQMPNARKN